MLIEGKKIKVPVRHIARLIHHVTIDSVKIEVIENTSNSHETHKEEGTIWLMNQEGKVILEKALKEAIESKKVI